jgi:hypothetical protein
MDDPLIKKVYSRKHPIYMDIAIGDLHDGHYTGIASRNMPEGKVLNKGQEWLLGVFNQRFIPELKHIIKKLKPKLVHGLTGGDMGDMDAKGRSAQYWSKKATVITENAIEVITPFIELLDCFHAVRGTKSHTNAELDSSIAKNFDNCEGVGYEARYILDDVYCIARHKGKNRSVRADENLLNGLRSDIIKRHAAQKTRIPDISYRHHFHWFGTTPEYKPFRVIQVPSWQLPYDHDYVAEIDAVGGTAYVGGVVSVIQKGKLVEVIDLLYTYPKEKPWEPEK